MEVMNATENAAVPCRYS